MFYFVTYKCQLRCLHCYLSDIKIIKESRHSALDVLRLILTSSVKEIRLTGGEPFHNKEIINILKLIKKRKIIFTIASNGINLSDEIKAEIFKNKDSIKTIWFSLYGASKKDYESITNSKGSYEEILINVKELLKEGINVGVNANISFGETEHWLKTLDHLANIGVKRLKLLKVCDQGEAKKNWIKFYCSPEEWIKRIKTIKELLRTNDYEGEWRITKAFVASDELSILPEKKRKEMACLLNNRSLLSVDSKGDIYPCCLLAGKAKYKLGNLKNQNDLRKVNGLLTEPIKKTRKFAFECYDNSIMRTDGKEYNRICPLYLVDLRDEIDDC